MCIITMTALGTALGMTSAAIASATAASTAGISALGVATGIANAVLAAGAIAGVAGSATSAISANQQAKAQQAQYEYQAKVAEENARIAQNNAALERQQGIEEARLQRIKAAQAIGSQETAMAANGIDVTQGTALDVIEDTAAMGELDALQTRYNYERKALAYEAEGNNFKNQANLDIIAGQNAYSAGRINALASGLDGISKAGSVASRWFGFSGGGGNGGLNVNQSKKQTGLLVDSAYNNLG